MNTVLLISEDQFELTTEEVIDWIIFYGFPFERINGNIIESYNFIYFKNFNKRWSFVKTNIKDIKSVWYRRWGGGQKIHYDLTNIVNNNQNFSRQFKKYFSIINNIDGEYSSIGGYFLKDLEDLNKKYLTRLSQVSVNKLIVLQKAIESGLKVPEFSIVYNKKDLLKYKKKWNRLITKDINTTVYYESNGDYFTTQTKEIEESNTHLIPESFEASFIQKYIEKEFEIRSFFLNGDIYSMAIFSQEDEQTRIDFRNYNYKKPNRTVPYNLPKKEEMKIIELMKKLNLETGSIDIIKNQNNYFFLEVNPIGQLGMVSNPCNYQLEEKIAKYLIS